MDESTSAASPEPDMYPHPSPAPPFRVKAVIRRGGRYLLAMHNNRVPENKGKWTFLGGLIDPGDATPAHALVRELREELEVSGRVLGEVGNFAHASDPGPCVVLLADFDGEPRPNEEILALRWFTREQVEAIGRAGLLHMGLELEAITRAERRLAGQ
jgi:8-oxo-dGTP pyrophosphatase MutT (NUDIX family)